MAAPEVSAEDLTQPAPFFAARGSLEEARASLARARAPDGPSARVAEIEAVLLQRGAP